MPNAAASRPGGEHGRSAMETIVLRFSAAAAVAVGVEDVDDLPAAVSALGLSNSLPTLVLVGGADGIEPAQLAQLRPLFDDILVPIVAAAGGAIVDGGTDSGVMGLMGRAVASVGRGVPLVGVAAAATVTLPGSPDSDGKGRLEPHHSHFVLVPGERWGDESEWLSRVATVLAGTSPSVTVLVNGGETAWQDVECSVAAGRPVIVLDGSGRAADQISTELGSSRRGDRADRLAASELVEVVPLDAGGQALADAVRARLGKE